jgi:uncharacterized DUF497 family protein
VQFEWDGNKAAANFRKHKVSFDEALTVFRDAFALIFDDEGHSVDEDREIIIGHSNRNRVLLVCFTGRAKEVIRIFSARLATKKEKADYEENASF